MSKSIFYTLSFPTRNCPVVPIPLVFWQKNTIFNFRFTTICESPDSYLVEKLFSSFPNIRELFTLSEQDLITFKGIGPKKAKQIAAALHLARMLQLPEEDDIIITSPKIAYEVVKNMQFLDRENFVILGLNTKNRVILKETVSIGTLSSSLVHPREVFKPLIRFSCGSVILTHNHPSGICTPSSDDLAITNRLVEAGKLLGIEVVDHVILGFNNYCSLKERGDI